MKIIFHRHTLETTLDEIRRLAFDYRNDLEIFKDLSFREFFNFVSKKIAYVKDPDGVELVMRPFYTLKRGSGDCDDKTCVCLAFFALVADMRNIPEFGVSIVSDRSATEYTHIFPWLKLGGTIFDFDATYPHNTPGQVKNWKIRKNISFYKKAG